MSKRKSEMRDCGRHLPSTTFRFLPKEVAQLEKVFEACTNPKRQVIQSLADNFSNALERKGQAVINRKQISTWFKKKRYTCKWHVSKELYNSPNIATTKKGDSFLAEAKETVRTGSPSAKKSSDGQRLEFEAKSSRDCAWYDVSTFLAHRMSNSGDPEILVRYVGFGADEDEWVDLETSVRQRSLPCEGFECVAVLSGDLILCYQEGSEHALYYDANIVDVQRRRHDIRGCRCRFWVRYQHDLSEEVVPLRKVCRRPESNYRLKPMPQIPSTLVPENAMKEDKPVTRCTTSDSSAEQRNRTSHSDIDMLPNASNCVLTENCQDTVIANHSSLIPTSNAAAVSTVSVPASISDPASTFSDSNSQSPENLPMYGSGFETTCYSRSPKYSESKQDCDCPTVATTSSAHAVVPFDCKQCTCWWE